VTNGELFTRSVFQFGQDTFAEAGWGAVVITEGGFVRHDDGRIDAVLTYMPTATHREIMPSRAYELAHSYDPEKEVVFVMVSQGGDDIVLVLKDNAQGFPA
jgi:hypothetical protein